MMEIGNHHLATIMEGTGFPGGAVVKKPTANAGDAGSAPGLGRPPEGRHGNPLHVGGLPVLACRIPWTEEPGGLQSMRSQRDRHN